LHGSALVQFVPSQVAMSHPASVLVIDDDEVVTATFGQMLQQEGFDVRMATDPARGLNEAARARPDAILLDLRMPVIDGLMFLRCLREQETGSPTPVAIVTGDYLLDEETIDVAQELGATIAFKPLWLEDLVAIARQLVDVRAAVQA